MKNTRSIILFVFLLLIMGTGRAQDENTWQKFNLKGKVQSVAARESKKELPALKEKFRLNDPSFGKLGFNKDGVLKTDFDANSADGYIHDFDKNGNRQATLYQHVTTDAAVIMWYEYAERDGKKILYLKDSGKKLIRKEETSLNSDGRIAEKRIYNKDTVLTEVLKYTYDEKGQLTVLTKTLTGGGEEIQTWTRQNGLLKKSMVIWSFNNQNTESFESFYDEKENPVHEIINDYVKDKHLERQHEYVFDENGNWTKRSTYNLQKNKKKLIGVIDRTIEYYK